MFKLQMILSCAACCAGIASPSNAQSITPTTVRSIEYSIMPETGEEIVTATLEDGTLTYWPSTKEFRFRFNDGQTQVGTIAIREMDHTSGHYSMSMVLYGGEATGAYDLELSQIDENSADAALTVTKKPAKYDTYKTRPLTTIISPSFAPSRDSKRAGPRTQKVSGIGSETKISTANAQVIIPSVPPYPPLQVVCVGLVVIIVIDDACNKDDPYDCSTWWGWYWNGCWIW